MAKERGLDWEQFADYATDPGELLVAMFKHSAILNSWTKTEDEQRKFVRDHKPFFYDHAGKPDTRAIRRLWPNIGVYVKLWRTSKDDWAAWKAMSMELEKHGLPVPPLPPGARTTDELPDGETSSP